MLQRHLVERRSSSNRSPGNIIQTAKFEDLYHVHECCETKTMFVVCGFMGSF